ncbi:4-oxalocrotonate tautomerase family protein [Planosporangium thailandense]|uniref:Tautomerase n=1 Tax=Planosporangium thailandense TaxID=765197 RepID=A0ABX0Y464_9ACTN|nr:2-hydroxymuconate tautomerase [Planosporangium thailandense]NJC72200.1 4-oxalocrotonate tautomerase family protein [Planosporangium thailandense]
MPMIHVEMYPGRTPEQKADLVREVTDAFVRTCGGNPDGVWVVIQEVPGEHWGVGGQLASGSGSTPRHD